MAEIRWTDGRSGESGRYAGNLVLDHIDPSGHQISNHKGTVFIESHRCWIGRVVADDAYLTAGVLHWANVSADQHREMMQFGKETRRDLLYLFVTAHPDLRLIRFWQVPAAVLERELKRRGKDAGGSVLGLHISEREGRHMLGEADVTEYYAEFKIDPVASAKLTTAVRSDRKRKDRAADAKPNNDKPAVASTPSTQNSTRRFEIPLSGGRLATFSAPVPLTAQDLTRVKGYIDLMSDILVDS
jgi:hypothetical protein